MVYKFPETAAFGKAVPKSRIYEHASPTASVKKLIVNEVEKIIWSYKLSPETINLPASGDVKEIQVFTVLLKTATLKYGVLSAIDKAIPSPIIFILSFENKIRYTAAYKRQSEADKNKWVVSDYFETEWIPKNAKFADLPIALNMKSLYGELLKSIIPLKSRNKENIEFLVNRSELLSKLKRETEKQDKKLKKEKQFNRKVELNTQLRKLKQKIEKLQK